MDVFCDCKEDDCKDDKDCEEDDSDDEEEEEEALCKEERFCDDSFADCSSTGCPRGTQTTAQTRSLSEQLGGGRPNKAVLPDGAIDGRPTFQIRLLMPKMPHRTNQNSGWVEVRLDESWMGAKRVGDPPWKFFMQHMQCCGI